VTVNLRGTVVHRGAVIEDTAKKRFCGDQQKLFLTSI
jgi:hypothetical protein